jgi:hypothetical protein
MDGPTEGQQDPRRTEGGHGWPHGRPAGPSHDRGWPWMAPRKASRTLAGTTKSWPRKASRTPRRDDRGWATDGPTEGPRGPPGGDCRLVAARAPRDDDHARSRTGRIRTALQYLGPLHGCEGIEIRLHVAPMYNSIFRFDDDMFVTPHLYGTPGYSVPLLHVRRLGRMASSRTSPSTSRPSGRPRGSMARIEHFNDPNAP